MLLSIFIGVAKISPSANGWLGSLRCAPSETGPFLFFTSFPAGIEYIYPTQRVKDKLQVLSAATWRERFVYANLPNCHTGITIYNTFHPVRYVTAGCRLGNYRINTKIWFVRQAITLCVIHVCLLKLVYCHLKLESGQFIRTCRMDNNASRAQKQHLEAAIADDHYSSRENDKKLNHRNRSLETRLMSSM